ncbi:MAG: hypothetical protein GY866_02965 [Proteobacteria bacterium]|nr:hypothetical protein [Pseudomonadota bacterium]
MESLIRKTTQVIVDLPLEVDKSCVQEALAAVLYYNGKLTEKEARTMIGKTRREFEETIIPEFGLSMIGGTKQDIELEKKACLKPS